MKKILDWKNPDLVQTFNDVTLWSAPFGRLLLENIPMQKAATIVDIGFGTGFPLIELSQRFGETSTIYGIDVWEEAIQFVQKKIAVLELQNIKILKASASKINIDNEQVDLVTSNLGVNNFEEKEKVYAEIYRILKPTGRLCITTNPIGTFDELFEVFAIVLEEMNWKEAQKKLQTSIAHRKTKELLLNEFNAQGFKLTNSKHDVTDMRFVDAVALFNHSLIRVGFREYWADLVSANQQNLFFNAVIQKLDAIIDEKGMFKMSIPMWYLEFQKK